jgi:UDP-N-acetyl-D-glucosamine dehydrogenase
MERDEKNLNQAASETEPQALLERIRGKSARVGIIGMGYVGLPLALAAAGAEFPVTGFDIDADKVTALNAARSYFAHIPAEDIAVAVEKGSFQATADFSALHEMDIVLICVPTPLTAEREPDMTYVEGTARQVAEHLRPGQLVVLESTSYPGTTAGLVRPILEQGGLRSGRDFFLAYSPEREDPGNSDFGLGRIPKVVGADGEAALTLASAFYGQFTPSVVPVSNSETAEAVKITENVFRAVNIALVNELKVIFEAMGIDVWEVIEAAKTKPFGYMPFYPGPGLGGHCIPIDPFYLAWKAREFGVATRFIELAGEINAAMPRHVVERLTEALAERSSQDLSGARILVLGVAYKRNVDDTRGSASFEVIRLLQERGAEVAYHDPYVAVIPATRDHPSLAGMRSIAWDDEQLRQFDAAVILTDHDKVDYRGLIAQVPLVVDTRNALGAISPAPANVVKA